MGAAGAKSVADNDRSARLLPSVTCPHCWHGFRPSDIAWVAKHEDLRGDPVLGPDAYLRFLPTRFAVDGDAIDSRGMRCQRLACPRCHLIIPRICLESELLVLSLIGVPFSGKSYFLTSMTWELERLLPTRFALTFRDLDAGSNLTLTEYRTTLFLQDDPDKPVGIIKTQPDSASHYESVNLDGQGVLLPRPLLFSLAAQRRDAQGGGRGVLRRILCLYDNAGELFLPGQDTTQTPGTQHMARSRLLMFLFDPTQDPRIRDECRAVSDDPQLSNYAHTQLQSTILSEAAARVQQYAHLPAKDKLPQPLIVLVSKSDIWGDLIDEDIVTDPYVDWGPHVAGRPALVDVARIMRVSTAVRSLLIRLAPEFVATAEDCCDDVIYMPISALGCSPAPQEDSKMLTVRPREIKPHWVTVPVMYAFSKWASRLVPRTGQSGR